MTDGVSGGEMWVPVGWIVDVVQVVGVTGGKNTVLGWSGYEGDGERSGSHLWEGQEGPHEKGI